MSEADQIVSAPETPLPEATPPTVSAVAGWWAGVLGAALALAIGELADNLSERVTSLVIAIGELTIDLMPGEVVAESINTIGQLQKPLLIGGIVVVALLVGGGLGHGGRRRPWIVPLGFGVFGVIGGLAAARLELTDGPRSWLVALLAAAVGAVTTLGLLAVAARPANTPNTPIVPGAPLSQSADRRRFIAYGGAALGTAAVFAGSRVGRTSAAERAREEILTEAARTGATAVEPGQAVAPFAPTAGEFDGIDGLTRFITPISPRDEFYLIDTALQKPQVDPARWALTIDGYVERELSLTYDELMARDLVEREVTLSCVSNPVGGPLIGNAHWRGILLADLLDEAGVLDPTDAATQVFSRSVDGWTCGFPTPLAYDGRTAMLALEMNGEPLPIAHGFPARLVVAGLYGYVSATKWVERITVTDWDGVDGFWMPRGWAKEGPIKTQSRIDVPRNNATVDAGPVTVGGVAWSPTIGIDRVEVAVSDGEWAEAELAIVESDETWVQWRYEWNAVPGRHVLQVRATDKSGFTQSPIPVEPAPNGAEGYDAVRVRVT